MKGNILLIRPNNYLSVSNYPPLALILIGSTLEKAGYDVEIFAASNEENYLETIKSKVTNSKFLLVGLTVLTTEVADAICISKAIKEISNVPIAWGGWHVTLFPRQCAESKYVDYVIVDEGDRSVVKLADSLAKRLSLKHKTIMNENHLIIEELPLPNYSLVKDIEGFITRPLGDKFQEIMDKTIRWIPYQSSRGCPSLCTFCINVVTDNRKYRFKSARKVVEELEVLISKYNISHFKILDDNFFVSKKRVKEFCKLVIERRLEFTWDGECRVNYLHDGYLNDDFLQMLKKTGLVQLVIGAESGSKKTLNYLCKQIVPEETERAVDYLDRNGIIPDCSFIVGLPGETREDILKTSNLINRLRKHKLFLCGVHTYRPYPRSKIARQLISEGKLEEPRTLEEWADEKTVGLYTYEDIYRPWIQDYELAMNISYYQSLASGVWLLQHQIDNRLFRFINLIFRKISGFRSKHFFFAFAIDKRIYSYFRLKMYNRAETKWKKE